MKSALVVGGSGFLGLPTVRRLASHGYRVFATYHSSKHLPAIANVSWLPTDFTKPNACADWPTNCDYVIYLAQSRRNEAMDDVFQVNIHGLMQALHYARQANVRSAVVASSGSVYATQNAPAKESDTILLQGDRSFRDATMLVAELLVASFRSVLPIVQLRIFFPYGPGQNEDMPIPSLRKRIQQGQAIALHGPDGFLANPLYAPDAAAAIERCLNLQSFAILNLAGPENVRLRTIATGIGNVLKRTPVFEVIANESGPILVGATQAMQDALGWTPQTRWNDGLHLWLETKQKNAA